MSANLRLRNTGMGCECRSSVRSGPLRASFINQLQMRSVCCFESNVTCVRSVILKDKIHLFFYLDIHKDLFSSWIFLQIRVHVFSKSMVSAASIATRLQVGGSGFKFRHGQNILFSWRLQEPDRPNSGALLASYPLSGVKRSGREVNHSSTSSVVVKNEWSYTSAYKCFHGVYMESFTFGLGIQ